MARSTWTLLLILFAAGTGAALAQTEERCAGGEAARLCVDPAYPTQGEACQILVTGGGSPVEGAMIIATYRPNSEVSTVDTLGFTDAEGVLAWIPGTAGIATLAANTNQEELQSLTISVRFHSIPALGFVVMLLAAVILFGGNSYSFAKTFGKS